MQYSKLGNTDLTISELGFGCIPIIRLDVEQAVNVLQHAYDRGITFYDTANMYRDSEEKIGKAFAGKRDKIVIATKTLSRDAETVTRHIENSLRMLKTDYIDLFQFHQVAHEHEFDAITAPDGALEAVARARAAGKIRHVGFSSHSLAMALKLVKTGMFATVQFPFNFIEDEPKHELFPEAVQRGMGIIAMKPFAGGVIDNADIVFKFLRQFPEVTPIPGFDSVEYVDQVVSFYQQPNRIIETDRETMENYRVTLGKKFCRRCEYCQPCPEGVMITTAMGYNVIASRMSPKVSIEFCKVVMESVLNCIECGECVERCPYELPIPDMLKEHYDLYEKHRNGVEKQ